MRKIVKVFLLLLIITPLFATNYLKKIDIRGDFILLFFSSSQISKNYFSLKNPNREVFDFKNTKLYSKKLIKNLPKNLRLSQFNSNRVRFVIEHKDYFKIKHYKSKYDNKVYVIKLSQKVKSKTKTKTKKITKEKKVVLKKRDRIVIDAGHGGKDTGAIGGGKREKDVVLQVSKRVAKILKNRGYEVFLTRSTDKFLKLRERTKYADRKKATVFISIHANSISGKSKYKVHGIETYFLANNREARSQRVAKKENATLLKGKSKDTQEVIIDSILSGPKRVESNKLAIDIQRHIMGTLKKNYKDIKDNGVRSAPFWVLVGASRPSVLVEIGYISHPKERKRLFYWKYQKLLATGIANGIENYLINRKDFLD